MSFEKMLHRCHSCVIQRFRTRLYLPPGSEARLSFEPLSVPAPRLEAAQASSQPPMAYLELYHSSSDPAQTRAICDSGFSPYVRVGSKGPGLFLANHGLYASAWSPVNGQPAIVCRVPADPTVLRRFRSEMRCPPGCPDSEYLLAEPERAIPIGLIHFKLQGRNGGLGWSPDCSQCHAKAGCVCSPPGLYDPRDLVLPGRHEC